MDTPQTMTVRQGKCEIYPGVQEQMCFRINVIVTSLKPGPNADDDWVSDTTLKNEIVQCGQRGYARLLGMIDHAITPPTPRTGKGAVDARLA